MRYLTLSIITAISIYNSALAHDEHDPVQLGNSSLYCRISTDVNLPSKLFKLDKGTLKESSFKKELKKIKTALLKLKAKQKQSKKLVAKKVSAYKELNRLITACKDLKANSPLDPILPAPTTTPSPSASPSPLPDILVYNLVLNAQSTSNIGSCTLTLNRPAKSINMQCIHLVPNQTGMHLHDNRDFSVICADPGFSPINKTCLLTNDQMDVIMSGRSYIVVHSSSDTASGDVL